MSASPKVPADFKSVIPDTTNGLCSAFTKVLFQLPIFLFQFISYLLNTDGTLAGGFLRAIHPPGTIRYSFAPDAESADWLLANGQEVSRTVYPDLYSAIGDVYGTPSSPSNFKLPDHRAQFPLPIGALPSAKTITLGLEGGEETHVLTDPESPGGGTAHKHIFGRMTNNSDDDGEFTVGTDPNDALSTRGVAGTGGDPAQHSTGDYSGDYLETAGVAGLATDYAATAHNTMPPYIGVMAYIKT